MKFVRKLTMIEQSTNRTESMFAVCSGVLMYTLDVFTVARVSVDKIVAFCPVQTRRRITFIYLRFAQVTLRIKSTNVS